MRFNIVNAIFLHTSLIRHLKFIKGMLNEHNVSVRDI